MSDFSDQAPDRNIGAYARDGQEDAGSRSRIFAKRVATPQSIFKRLPPGFVAAIARGLKQGERAEARFEITFAFHLALKHTREALQSGPATRP